MKIFLIISAITILQVSAFLCFVMFYEKDKFHLNNSRKFLLLLLSFVFAINSYVYIAPFLDKYLTSHQN